MLYDAGISRWMKQDDYSYAVSRGKLPGICRVPVDLKIEQNKQKKAEAPFLGASLEVPGGA